MMASKLELMLEAERRGILPPDRVAMLDEARKRGLVPANGPTAAPAAVPEEPDAPPEHGLANNIAQGAIRGAAGIGTTLLWPVDALKDMVSPKQKTLADLVAGTQPMSSHEKRKAQIDEVMREVADVDSLGYKGGKIGAEIAGTAGVGGALGKGAAALGAAKLAPLLESGGMTLGDAATKSTLANALMRATAGATTGGASAALMDPEQAGTGAAIGAAIPGATKLAGLAGDALAPAVSQPVADLYRKAQEMGVRIPADRLGNSKLLNALSSSLGYVPFSGRLATENNMLSDINRAASRTMGEDTSNLAAALKGAKKNLGAKFDATLKGTNVSVDDALLGDLTKIQEQAGRELTPDQAKIIGNQVDDILGMANDGVIEGQAAYNLKRNLDRIAKRNSPEAHWAAQLRNSLVDGLNRSLGDEGAQAFQQVRQQYGNMKSLSPYALNGAEGELSAARLGSLRNVRSQDLQDVADVAAQFVKGRESPHGAMQRVTLGTLGLGAGAGGALTGLLAPIAGGMTVGRLANTALNSNAVKEAMLARQKLAEALANSQTAQSLLPVLRTLPIAAGAD